MQQLIEELRAAKDSTGGIVNCLCRQVPAGLGEPVFDKLEARLAQAMLSIPATKGFDIGSGFAGISLRGSRHNDPFVSKGQRPTRQRADYDVNISRLVLQQYVCYRLTDLSIILSSDFT